MQEINVYVKGVVYQNKGKGFALSAWAVKGEPVHYIEHDVESAYGAELEAIVNAIINLNELEARLHFYSNQKALMTQGNKRMIPTIRPIIQEHCDFTWCPLKESPDDLLRLRDMAMREVEKRGKARV